MPRPLSYADHRKFVETEKWTKKGTAGGSAKTGDHFRYSFRLNNGDVLQTRVSHGSGAINDPSLVAAILREQLRVAEVDFYRCVNDGELPNRPHAGTPVRPSEGIDAKLIRNLIRKVGLTQSQIAAMTKSEAIAAWDEYLVNGQV